jgi:hypothetical protein
MAKQHWPYHAAVAQWCLRSFASPLATAISKGNWKHTQNHRRLKKSSGYISRSFFCILGYLPQAPCQQLVRGHTVMKMGWGMSRLWTIMFIKLRRHLWWDSGCGLHTLKSVYKEKLLIGNLWRHEESTSWRGDCSLDVVFAVVYGIPTTGLVWENLKPKKCKSSVQLLTPLSCHPIECKQQIVRTGSQAFNCHFICRFLRLSPSFDTIFTQNLWAI